MNVLSLYIFVVIFFSWASALERAEPINHHPVLSKTLFLFGYLKHLTRLRIFNFFITPLHLNFALPDISSSINRRIRLFYVSRKCNLVED